MYRDNLSIEEFFVEFLYPNRPCLISNLTTSWNANEWCDGNVVRFDFLASAFGNQSVPVSHCDVKEFNANPKSDWVFKEYLKYWREHSQSVINMASGTSAVSGSENSLHLLPDEIGELNKPNCYYLKDWHFTRDVIDYCPYTTPTIFASDWLNEFCSQRVDLKDDYRFVYMGGRGTWTPLHYDVFRSYSWSSNIVGAKMWILFPSGDEKWLKNIRGELTYDVMSELKGTPAGEYIRDILALAGALNCKEEHFREFSLTTEELNSFKGNSGLKIASNPLEVIRVIVVLQRKGDTIFVPSGWHHQVHNLDDVISINHNWINACNLYEMWTNLRNELERVRESISDCVEMEGWHSQCQLILSSLAGMDYIMFCKFILIISLPRLIKLKDLCHGNPEFETIFKVCDKIIIYTQGFLIEQMEFKIGSMVPPGYSSFIPSTNSLGSFIPSVLGNLTRDLSKHIIFLFFELSKILTVLRELVESKEFDLYLGNSKLCSLMYDLKFDLSSIWESNKHDFC